MIAIQFIDTLYSPLNSRAKNVIYSNKSYWFAKNHARQKHRSYFWKQRKTKNRFKNIHQSWSIKNSAEWCNSLARCPTLALYFIVHLCTMTYMRLITLALRLYLANNSISSEKKLTLDSEVQWLAPRLIQRVRRRADITAGAASCHALQDEALIRPDDPCWSIMRQDLVLQEKSFGCRFGLLSDRNAA